MIPLMYLALILLKFQREGMRLIKVEMDSMC